jgi:hypothetical protein
VGARWWTPGLWMESRQKGRLAWKRLPSGTLETGSLLRTLQDNPPVHAGGFFFFRCAIRDRRHIETRAVSLKCGRTSNRAG